MQKLLLLTLLSLMFFSCKDVISEEQAEEIIDVVVEELSKPDDGLPYVLHEVETRSRNLEFFWKDDSGKAINNFKNLKMHLESKGKKMVFAMNGGMYLEDYSPQGLFVANGKELRSLNTKSSKEVTNFYWKPNGVFYINKSGKSFVIPTAEYPSVKDVAWATQSGPMMLIDSVMHKGFKSSKSKYIRNGVGIMPNGNAVFLMSKRSVRFETFANYFKDLGCKNALYLDGAVSQTYLPEKDWIEWGYGLGVLIAETDSL